MIVLMCRSRVVDPSKWDAAGLRLRDRWRDADDPDQTFFVFEVASLDRARAFLEAPFEGDYRFLSTAPGY